MGALTLQSVVACHAAHPVLAVASDIAVYILPICGSMLLFYGIF